MLGCKMFLKVHLIHSYVKFFTFNFADISDEHGERFHQDISEMENRYKRNLSFAMLADIYWTLQRDQTEASHKKCITTKNYKLSNINLIFNILVFILE